MTTTLSVILIFAALELFSFYILDKKDQKKLFFREENLVKALSPKHLKLHTLDPHLGYTFSNHDQSALDEPVEDGYIILGKEDSALRILTLGGSTTENFFRKNNWPKKLYKKITDTGLPVKIFNGGVAGYISGQEIIKLLRDINLIKPDIVISYSGVNEVTEASLKNSFYHKFHNRLFNTLTKQSMPQILPNFFTLLGSKNKKFVTSFGSQGVGSVTSTYLNNIRAMYEISKIHDAKFIHVLQPYLKPKEDLVVNFVMTAHYEKNITLYDNFYSQLRARLSVLDYSFNFENALLPTQDVFTDDCHLNDLGNRIVSDKIYKLLEDQNLL